MMKELIINKIENCRGLIAQFSGNSDNIIRLKGIEKITNKIEKSVNDIDLLTDINDRESYIKLMIKICDDNIEYMTKFMKRA